MKKLIATGLIGSLFAFSLSAQTAPNATVDPVTGDLILEGGTVIPVPDGTVDANGDLVIGSNPPIPAPTATVLPDGSLDLGGGTVLAVPALPTGAPFINSWFGSDLYDYRTDIPVETNQWYFSFRFKNLFHFASNNWFYSEEFDAIFYIAPETGARNLDQGIWAYTPDLFNGQTEGTWVYIAGTNGFHDLRDQNDDGVLEIPDGEAGAQSVNGFLFVINASGYPTTQKGFFFFGEFDAGNPPGNYIWRAGDIANAQKVRDPA